MNIIIREYSHYQKKEALALYTAVGWTSYTNNPAMLEAAFAHSLLTLGAYDGKTLVGIIRVVGDGVSILFIQDILILPAYQRQGIGTKLLREVLTRFPSVYQIELMTDDTPETNAFYESLGFRKAADLNCCAFIQIHHA